ncbi:hypothetical protein BABINDRAFT_159783 [Babjeviella inositovora NRRL Y-12698]|uniref:Pyruvate decarboxylase n=1 Tax=Babjeviella inositovora NRRL Y-12698 TaxID=984486 RepID=A0A1E3QWQ0_9ASCO|nr:uncharacterized protein BABINDRAFT_159783 [Babjeviella inositovora NRRL Y-12698]ODQ81502.1 hypothetical protein BABINDRAFT_159783 [Babjeviella inositovora NRRL Y-12698]
MAPIATFDHIKEEPVSAVAPQQLPNSIPLGEYVFRRISQLGVKSIFGVPGDFQLGLLEHLYTVEGLKWVGNCNELNSAYAADGYARASKNMGVTVTTFGVGELSAINGIAGAFAEYVPVLHIVGTSPTGLKTQKALQIHHLVGAHSVFLPTDHSVYEKMVSGISCSSVVVENAIDFPQKLDTLLSTIYQTSRPGYLFLPIDLVNEAVASLSLEHQIARLAVDADPAKTDEVVDKIVAKITAAKTSTAILGDVLTSRFGMVDTLRKIVDVTKFNNFTSMMGKSVLDESNTSFIGDYNGALCAPGVKEALESHDLIMHVGAFANEINTAKYTYDIEHEKLIQFHHEFVSVCGEIFRGVHFAHVLPKLLAKLETMEFVAEDIVRPVVGKSAPIASPMDISQSWLIDQMASFIKEDDIVVCETGSFMFGLADIRLPKNASLIAQGFYLSIGYALPACLGVGVALKDMGSNGRLILIEGDGSAQMTVQEFATFVRQDIKPTVFLLNNNGYTVERIIEGATRSYNDISPDWKWTELFKVFGDIENKTECVKVDTKIQLTKLMANSDIQKCDKLRLIEVILHPMDAPWRFGALTEGKYGTFKPLAL